MSQSISSEPAAGSVTKPMFLLTVIGDSPIGLPEHRRVFPTYALAEREATRVLGLLADRTAHRAIIDGPQCGVNGRTVY